MNDEIQKWQWWNLWGKDKVKMTKKQKQSNEDRINQPTNQPTNQPWLEMTTFKTEQKHGNQKENKEIDRHKWKTEENGWKWLEKMGIENS